MKITRLLWDMPITIELRDHDDAEAAIERIFAYFRHIDAVFNTFRTDSEISRINRRELKRNEWSSEMAEVILACEQTKNESGGYFDHTATGSIDPLGIVKGWAVHNAAEQLKHEGCGNFYIDAGGDMEVSGNGNGTGWRVGIRNPAQRDQIIKTIRLRNGGIATSGTYIRGNHIISPIADRRRGNPVVSLTVIAGNVYDADRFATAAFAMGNEGIAFIASRGLAGYQIDSKGQAVFTDNFSAYAAA